jgi:hypothetical protein
MMRSVVAAREGPATTAAAPTANAPKPTRTVRRELSIVIRVSLSCVLRRTIGAFSNKVAFLLVMWDSLSWHSNAIFRSI